MRRARTLAVLLAALRAGALLVRSPPPRAPPRAAPRCAQPALHAGVPSWDESLSRLAAYKERWGTADATLSDDEGRWVRVQRRLRQEGKLSAEREAALEALGVSWEAPSEVDDPVEQADWEDMCGRLSAYVAEHGNAQVPKKYKPDPALGGWVAAVRRARLALGAERVAQLDARGFEWVSTRKCGSKFMLGFAALRDFHAARGHVDVAGAAAASDSAELAELARWCEAQRGAHARGLLKPKQAEYLEGLGFL